ncbi:MAG: hypothetical protein L6305_05995 [Actinomycetia bacterium]|nr:hypothetical protein [Actinomycetes bacterium]
MKMQLMNYTIPMLVISIVLTWGGGLLIPALIRYVFIRRPINKFPALFIVIILYFIQIFVWVVVLGSTSKTHAALFFVAYVSYYILNKGYKKEASKEKENQMGLDEKI